MAKNFLQQVMVARPKSDIKIDGLVEKIENGYLSGREPSFKTKKSFSPSSLVYGSGACARYWYLAFNGAVFTDDADGRAVANMSNGTLSHGRIEGAFEKAGILAESEFKVTSEDPPIFGFGDVIFKWLDKVILGEIKTVRDEVFAFRKQNMQPADYHMAQLILYMKLKNMNNGAMIYENKNTHELLVIPVEMKEEYQKWVDDAFDWMRKVRKAWIEKTIPKNIFRSNSKVCKTCPIIDACKAAEPGTLKIERLQDFPKL